MKYDLSAIMSRAWAIFRKGGLAFAEALHRAWQSAKARPQNAAAIAAAKAARQVFSAQAKCSRLKHNRKDKKCLPI